MCSDRFRFALPVDGISDDQDRYMVIVIKSLLSSEMQCAFVF